jgi:hypothetical protein
MLERAVTRTMPVVNRAADFAPVLPACCNVCRTCTTTNLLGIATGGLVAAVAGFRTLVRRIVPT